MIRARGDERAARHDIAWVAGACAVSIALGLTFVFIRAPHPWGWQGFDHYDDLGRALARGEPYPTLDRIWGYPLFLSLSYRTFGDRAWPALVLQVLLNGAIPAIVYSGIRTQVDRRIAIVAAVLVGVASFNTVYTSTQSSDALCTVFTVAGVTLVARAIDKGRPLSAAGAGLLLGCAAQLRPNMLLLPLALAAILVWRKRTTVAVAAIVAATAALVDVPWTVRNAWVSGRFIPTTTRGGVQLWYGTVQVPPYFSNWTLNPATAYEARFFDYSRPAPRPVTITARKKECAPASLDRVVFHYRVGRRGPFERVEASRLDADAATVTIPRPPLGGAIHYYFDTAWRAASGVVQQMTPLAGDVAPLIQFMADDDLRDLDADDELLDAYDVVKLLRAIAWPNGNDRAGRLDFDHDGTLSRQDLDVAVSTLARPSSFREPGPEGRHVVRSVDVAESSVTAVLQDGSTITAPKQWPGAITDVRIVGATAGDVMRSRRSLDRLGLPATSATAGADACLELAADVDNDFAVREPQVDSRYQSLAFTNIRQTPAAFAVASARRFFEVFIVSGPGDPSGGPPLATGGGRIYRLARLVTLMLFALTIAGLWLAWRRRLPLEPYWIAIAYIPLTLCYMTTNMRYTVAVQPFQFIFIAIASDALLTQVERWVDHAARGAATD